MGRLRDSWYHGRLGRHLGRVGSILFLLVLLLFIFAVIIDVRRETPSGRRQECIHQAMKYGLPTGDAMTSCE